MEHEPQSAQEAGPEHLFHHRELAKRLHGVSEGESEHELQEHIFLCVVFDRFLDTLEEELFDQDWTEEEISEFFETLEEYDDAHIANAIAIPKEIRSQLFLRMHERITNDHVSPSALARELVEKNHERGFTIGYHVSPSEIELAHDGRWDIYPTELDARDNMKMAYYSLDYEHIYRERSSKFLYLVRGITGEGTSHKQDGNNHWGRAPFLSIIESISLTEADHTVEEIMKELHGKKPPVT